MKQFLNLKNKIHNFLPSTKGVAAVEFALILPLMLLIYLGTVEASRAISYHSRITSIAAALGDLVGQTESNLTENQLEDFFEAAQAIIAPYPSDGVQQKVSNIYVDDEGNTSRIWFYSNGMDENNIELPQNIIDVSTESYVIVSEVRLAYKPITSYIFPVDINFYQRFYHLPRSGNCIDFENSC